MLAHWNLVSVEVPGPSGLTQTVMLRNIPTEQDVIWFQGTGNSGDKEGGAV
jgi:hypothetical protein